MKTKLLVGLAIAFSIVSCSKYNLLKPTLGGTQSPIGEVNNTFTFSNPTGLSGATASVTDLTDGISTISYSVQLTDSKLIALANYITVANLSGNTLSGTIQAKITSDGIETVHAGGKCILVKYSSRVGDKYTLETENSTITREVMSISTEDDYFWGGMLIKTIVVEETGHSTPGISKIEYIANHRFGLVGAKIHFPDGTSKSIDVYSSATN